MPRVMDRLRGRQEDPLGSDNIQDSGGPAELPMVRTIQTTLPTLPEKFDPNEEETRQLDASPSRDKHTTTTTGLAWEIYLC